MGDMFAIGGGLAVFILGLSLGTSLSHINGVYRDLLIDQGAEYDWGQEKRVKFLLLGTPIGVAFGAIFGLMSLFS